MAADIRVSTLTSAPADIRYCCRCATPLATRTVAGKPRRHCPECGYIHFIEPRVGVGAMVIESGKLLLIKRAVPPEKGLWSLPAGYADIGEPPADTAVREVWEETRLRVRIERLLDVYHNPPEQGGAAIFILYLAHLAGGELTASDDALDAGFFGPNEMPELAFASTRDAVRRLASLSFRVSDC